MNVTTPRAVLSLSAFALLVTGAVLSAGPLNPPPGPVIGTAKPLSEVEPRIAINATNTPGDADSLFKITAPGSYYVTGNITGVVGKHGIEITASGVTLDLNGFDLVGVPGMGAFDGVSVTGFGMISIAVVNGVVRSWGDEGVDLGSNVTINCRVERVRASNNAGFGILTSDGSTVANCSTSGNTGGGISANGGGTTVLNCTAFANGGFGIGTGSGSTVLNCVARENNTGISAGSCSTVSNCSAFLNTGNGITAGAACTVSNCSAASNTGNGISANSSSTVADCTARVNSLDGIVVSSNCAVRGNNCPFNGNGAEGGAGIHAVGADNRIEGNNCTGADRGVDVDAAGNIIIRNTCAGNTIDWDIAANNVVGPILDRRAPASAAINGFSGPDSTGSAHPHANFSY